MILVAKKLMKAKKKPCDGCGDLQYIWKNVTVEGERKRYCKTCWSRQTVSKPTKRKPLSSRSPKRIADEKTYSKKRRTFLEKHPHCQARIPGVCTGNSTDVHHMAGRIGDNYLDEGAWLSVCRACHMWIEEHPKEARAMGFSKSKI